MNYGNTDAQVLSMALQDTADKRRQLLGTIRDQTDLNASLKIVPHPEVESRPYGPGTETNSYSWGKVPLVVQTHPETGGIFTVSKTEDVDVPEDSDEKLTTPIVVGIMKYDVGTVGTREVDAPRDAPADTQTVPVTGPENATVETKGRGMMRAIEELNENTDDYEGVSVDELEPEECE